VRLELGKVKIENISFSQKTYIKNKTLYINKEELSSYLKEDKNIQKVEIELARPGESVRIIPIKDVVEPRVKITGGGQVFPGYLGGVETIGEGITHILDGGTCS
jgi:glycine reductase